MKDELVANKQKRSPGRAKLKKEWGDEPGVVRKIRDVDHLRRRRDRLFRRPLRLEAWKSKHSLHLYLKLSTSTPKLQTSEGSNRRKTDRTAIRGAQKQLPSKVRPRATDYLEQLQRLQVGLAWLKTMRVSQIDGQLGFVKRPSTKEDLKRSAKIPRLILSFRPCIS